MTHGQQQSKRRHVKAARQSRYHTCHWPGCKQQVPPAMWGCKRHWFRLPQDIRVAIWRSYEIGQEETGEVSEAYLDAARRAQEWIKANAA